MSSGRPYGSVGIVSEPPPDTTYQYTMSETTEFDEQMSREEVADYLRSIADEFERGDPASVRLGNKRVELRPAESVNCEGAVTEQSPLIGSDREELSLTLSWVPRPD